MDPSEKDKNNQQNQSVDDDGDLYSLKWPEPLPPEPLPIKQYKPEIKKPRNCRLSTIFEDDDPQQKIGDLESSVSRGSNLSELGIFSKEAKNETSPQSAAPELGKRKFCSIL